MVIITPMVKQAIGLLALSKDELVCLIKTMTDSNPFLAVDAQVPLFKQDECDCDVEIIPHNKGYRAEIRVDGIPQLMVTKTAIGGSAALHEARWFVRSIKRRQEILLDVATGCVELQRDFLDKGKEFLKPLTARELARHRGFHESTVSRIVRNKTVKTPQGKLALKDFLKKDTRPARIKEIIKKCTDKKTGSARVPDSQITRMLAKENIIVSRRLVARYRNFLGIKPAAVNRSPASRVVN